MSIKVDKQEQYIVITPDVEKLDGTVAPALKSELVMANAEGFRNIVIDMTAARYCDSSGLSAILVGNRLCKNAEGSFVICGIQDSVMKLIKISQLDSILNIVPTVSEAIDMVILEDGERSLISDIENDGDEEE